MPLAIQALNDRPNGPTVEDALVSIAHSLIALNDTMDSIRACLMDET